MRQRRGLKVEKINVSSICKFSYPINYDFLFSFINLHKNTEYLGRRTENTKESNTFHITTVLSQTKISCYDTNDDEDDNNTRPCFQGAANFQHGGNPGMNEFGFQISDNYYRPLANTTANPSLNQYPAFGSFNTSIGHFNAEIDRPVELFDGKLPFGRFILYLSGDRNSVYLSGVKCGISVTEKQTVIGTDEM